MSGIEITIIIIILIGLAMGASLLIYKNCSDHSMNKLDLE